MRPRGSSWIVAGGHVVLGTTGTLALAGVATGAGSATRPPVVLPAELLPEVTVVAVAVTALVTDMPVQAPVFVTLMTAPLMSWETVRPARGTTA